jgi:hypothetical protein
MNESELLDELVRRTGVSRANVETVLRALAEARHEERRNESAPGTKAASEPPTASPYTPSYTPAADEVERLIRDAGDHPLGLGFLLEGNLCAVATLFRVHAFTVDAARQRLKHQGTGTRV